VGASPYSSSLFEALARAFPAAALSNNYGLTEAGPLVFGRHPLDLPRPPASVGHPLADIEVKLVGDDPDEGVLLVRTPAAMLGYDQRPEATAARLHDGWLLTGDVFRRDKDGWFYFVSRTDDVFKSGGESVVPAEVEGILERQRAIRQAAVVPVSHELKGLVPVAFVILRDNAEATEGELKEWVLANGPPHQHPRRVFFVKDFPLAASFKVDKAALRKIAESKPSI
jgi:acyl-coenzyme A synthetase/AMP-(fatty) acid ligase